MKRPEASPVLDWSMAVAGLWLSGGILLDAWHHFHATIETFFEWSHAVLYAGLFASFAVIAAAIVYYRRRGFSLRYALPSGYDATLSGLFVFLIGGVLDLVKHGLWGFEQGFDALLSVPHLVIGAGIFLTIAGPLFSAVSRERRPRTLAEQLPMILSLAAMMELVHWGLQFVFLSEAERMNTPLDPAAFPHDTLTLLALQYFTQGYGLLAVIVQSLLMSGAAWFLARRFTLATGAVTLLFVVGNVFIALAHSNYPGQFVAVVAASVVAGLVVDLMRLGPGASNGRWALGAFLSPASYWATMLVTLAITMNGIWWTPDVIGGAVVFAGISGLFVNALTSSRRL